MKKTAHRDDEDTLEMQLSSEQVRALAQADAARQQREKAVANALFIPRATPERVIPPAVALIIVSASVFAGGLSYFVTEPGQAQAAPPVPTPVALTQPAFVDNTPVHFANPFDESEVFVFAPGTSQAEAREAVADFLLQRALEREHKSQPGLAQR